MYIIAVVSFLLILLVLNIIVVDFAMDFMANGYKMISVVIFSTLAYYHVSTLNRSVAQPG